MIKECQKQNIPIVVDLPPLHDGQTKNDWNDELKFLKNGNDLEHKKPLTKVKSLTLGASILAIPII